MRPEKTIPIIGALFMLAESGLLQQLLSKPKD